MLHSAVLLDIDIELSASLGESSGTDSTLAEIRSEIVYEEEEADDVLEVEDDPPVSPTSLEAGKAF